jgi:hypothetical protein
LFSLFAAGVIDTGDNFLTPVANLPPISWTPVANLPPVSTAQEELVAKFAAGVVDTGANLPPLSLIPAAICQRCYWHRWQICHRCR